MLNPQQFRELIINPTLDRLDAYSEAASNLLLGTAIQESGLVALKQYGGGPALGLYQIEPATLRDLQENYLPRKDRLRNTLANMAGRFGHEEQLISNLSYATAIARIIYLRRPEPLPEAVDVAGLGHYWKTHFNTAQGKGKVSEFVEKYERYVGVMDA